jgi:hypothetical protein
VAACVAFVLLASLFFTLPQAAAAEGKSSEAASLAFFRGVEAGKIALSGLPAQYVILRTQALMALDQGKIDEAIALQEKLVSFADANLPTALRMRCRTEEIRLLFAYGRQKKGNVALEQALALLNSLGPERVEFIPPLMSIVDQRFQAGDLETGERLRNALLISMGERADAQESLESAVRAYIKEPFLPKERLAVVESWLSFRRNDPGRNQNGLMAEAAFALARQHVYRGNLSLARSYLAYANSIWTDIFDGESQEQLQFYALTGKLAESIGEFDSAEKSYRQGIDLGIRYYDPGVEKVAALRNDLSRLLLRKGALPEAEEMIRKTIRDVTNHQGQYRFQVGRGFSLLAMVVQARGDTTNASKYYKRAVDIMAFTLADDHPELIEARMSMAEDLLRTGRPDQAMVFAELAMKGSRELFGESSPVEVRALSVIGAIKKTRGDFDKAYTVMRHAEQLGTELARRMEPFPSIAARKKFFAASQRNMENLFDSLKDGRDAPRRVADLYDVWLNRKGIFFDSQMRFQQLQMAHKTPEEEEVLARLLSIRMEIASLAFSVSQSGNKKEAMRELQSRRKELVGNLKAMHKGDGMVGTVARWQDVTLPSGSALVDFASVGDSYKAFVLLPGGEPRMVDLGESETVDTALLLLRQEVAKGPGYDPVNGRKQAMYLCSRIFSPLSELVGKMERIIVVPDGLLNALPLEIFSPGPGKYLIETHRFSYLATARELLEHSESSEPTGRVVAFANPDFATVVPDALVRMEKKIEDTPASQVGRTITLSLPPLPETEKEGQAIVRMAGEDGVLFSGAGASKMALFGQRRPKILHLATHGFFFAKAGTGVGKGMRGFVFEDATTQSAEVWLDEDAEPLLRSGLVLAGANSAQVGAGIVANGLLTAEEVLSLDLFGTNLVTLSACDTGLGVISDEDGVYGLRRSFRLAGAGDLILSMWSVPDRETRELMVSMYARILKEKKKPGRSLHEATLERLEHARTIGVSDNPLLWTGFIQYGVD